MKWVTVTDPERDRRCVPLPIGFPKVVNSGHLGVEVVDPVEPNVIHGHLADTRMAALMATPPNHEPEPCVIDGLEMRDSLQDAIESIQGVNRWIWDSHVNRALSFRQIADELGRSKSAVHRRYHKTRDDLADILTLRGVI